MLKLQEEKLITQREKLLSQHYYMPTGKTPRSLSWVGGKVLQHYYNVPSLKQQNKASTILSEITLPETSNIDDVVNDHTEHKNDTPAIENVAVDIQNPTNSLSLL